MDVGRLYPIWADNCISWFADDTRAACVYDCDALSDTAVMLLPLFVALLVTAIRITEFPERVGEGKFKLGAAPVPSNMTRLDSWMISAGISCYLCQVLVALQKTLSSVISKSPSSISMPITS